MGRLPWDGCGGGVQPAGGTVRLRPVPSAAAPLRGAASSPRPYRTRRQGSFPNRDDRRAGNWQSVEAIRAASRRFGRRRTGRAGPAGPARLRDGLRVVIERLRDDAVLPRGDLGLEEAVGVRLDDDHVRRVLRGVAREPRALQRDGGDDGLLDCPIGLDGQPVFATLLVTGEIDSELLETCRSLPNEVRGDLTQLPGLLVARCLASEALLARGWMIDLWRLLRPALLGRGAVPPRIMDP